MNQLKTIKRHVAIAKHAKNFTSLGLILHLTGYRDKIFASSHVPILAVEVFFYHLEQDVNMMRISVIGRLYVT